MADRRWLPSKYQDEVIPPPLESPDAWVITLPDGTHAIAPIDDGIDRNAWVLSEGEVVEFDWMENLGGDEIVITDDGSWELAVGEPTTPEGAYLCVLGDGDIDTLSESVEQFARNHIDINGEGGSYSLSFYCWSKQSTRCVFRAGALHPEPSEKSATGE